MLFAVGEISNALRPELFIGGAFIAFGNFLSACVASYFLWLLCKAIWARVPFAVKVRILAVLFGA